MSSEHNGAGISSEQFEEIINERKAEVMEKRKAKRRCDLIRIKEMKSRDGNNPNEIFPKEVWQIIAEKLSPEDRRNMRQVHDLFRDFMEKYHVRDNLFPQILKFRVENFWKREDDISEEDGELANCLELRGVSKVVKFQIDRFIEEDLLRRLRQGNPTTRPRKTTKFFLNGKHLERVDQLLSSLQTESRYRPLLISKSLSIFFLIMYGINDDHVLEIFQQFREKMTSLLKHVGDQIWHFHFRVRVIARGIVGDKVTIPFHEWVSLMPNLKWLNFVVVSDSASMDDAFNAEQLRSPLPVLENLERLDLDVSSCSECPQEADSISRTFLQTYSKNLKVLMVNGEMCGVISSVEFPKLDTIFTNMTYYFGVMESTFNFNWKLKRLNLRLDLEGDSIIPLFQFLEKFPTLEQLTLDIDNVTIGSGIDFLRLPRLTHFEMHITPVKIIYNAPIHFFFSLQFIIHCNNLRELIWSNDSEDFENLKRHLEMCKDRDSGNMIDFVGGWGNLKKTNLFNVFPDLEYLKVNMKVKDDNDQVCLMTAVSVGANVANYNF